MRSLFGASCFLLTLSLTIVCPRAQERVRHDLSIALFPDEHRFIAKDRLTLPEGFPPASEFLLHKGLNPSSPTAGVSISKEGERLEAVPLESYRVTLAPGLRTFDIGYGGRIEHPLEPYGKERARGFRQTPGVISPQGVYLSGSSFWYPRFGEELVTFALDVGLPLEWDAVSQGERTLHIREGERASVRWESADPQEEICLVASPFTEYSRPAGRVRAMVFLRRPDEALAKRYLDATVDYLALYERLIGPYPYEKFALVENFWETGLGLPSFALLGPKVIRLPFIVHSAFPHEILHNWWGNGVFPDPQKGNWSEGLTAYLSDHLVKEQRGKGVEYRLATLQKYADYVLSGRDFPLAQFRFRHSTSSEAVGYGKSLMFFHMLRRTLGDEAFVRGLQDFYGKNRFRFASYGDLRASFEGVSGMSLKGEFEQWITRPGAPQIRVGRAQAMANGGEYVLTALLEQVQPGDAYHLRIPVAVTVEGLERAYQTEVVMGQKTRELRLHLPAKPLRLDVDPEFDLFRRLHREEMPPALTQALGAKKMLILLPASARADLLRAYRELSMALSRSGPDEVEVRLDSEVTRLPSDRAVTLMGWENRFLGEITSALSPYQVTIDMNGVKIGATKIPRENHSIVLTARHPNDVDLSLTWISCDPPEAVAGLGRKLPHYHKYSYLGFEGREPANMAEGRWPVLDSPMTVLLPSDDGTMHRVEMGALAPREPLATLPEPFSKERMMETVRFLSSEALGGRGFGTEGLDRAATFIAGQFEEAGLLPAGDTRGSYFQVWEERGGDPERTAIMRNVVGVIPGTRPDLKGQSIVVGAHYDHLGVGWPDVREERHRGKIHPGADDNASGVAVLIELAGVLARGKKPPRSIIFAAFAGEEAGRMGSRHYIAKQERYPPDQCLGMINIDTVGRLKERKLLVFGAASAREWAHIFRGASYVTGVDWEVVPEEMDSSDQKSFQEAGIPAVQISSGPHPDYHRPTDTAERMDPQGLVKAASVVKEAVEYLAGRDGPLTTTLESATSPGSTLERRRKVRLGTIPDFAYGGDGYRLSGVIPGSPAELCGLREGDVIVRIGPDGVDDLKGLSEILKSLLPGERITITFLREGKEMTVETEVSGK